MKRIRIIAGLAAIALAAGSLLAQSAGASARPGQASVLVIKAPMTRGTIHDGKFIPTGNGRSSGDCGVSTLILHAGASTYNLTLFSTQGGMGVGSYSVYTDGFLQIATPGAFNANGATAWTSKTQRVLDPGLGASVGWVSGWVWTANEGPCGYVVSALWNN